MADITEITTEDVATISAAAVAPDQICEHPDGHVDHNGEKIVYEYDETGKAVAWHKEPAEVAE